MKEWGNGGRDTFRKDAINSNRRCSLTTVKPSASDWTDWTDITELTP